MKDLIRKILREYEEQDKILVVPSLTYFNNDWNSLQSFLEKKGNPKWRIGGDLYLMDTQIESLGNLQSVGGYLNLRNTQIESLGNLTTVGGNLDLMDTPIESLGNLTTVGGSLDLRKTSIKSLGNLISVGGSLDLKSTPISKKYSKEEIRQMVKVEGEIII